MPEATAKMVADLPLLVAALARAIETMMMKKMMMMMMMTIVGVATGTQTSRGSPRKPLASARRLCCL